MYVDLVDDRYNSTQFNLTQDSLGPLDNPPNVVKEYLSLLNAFTLVFSAHTTILEDNGFQ